MMSFDNLQSHNFTDLFIIQLIEALVDTILYENIHFIK